MAGIEAHYNEVNQRIGKACERAGRNRADVMLVAVSKYRPLDQTRALYELGCHNFGENRVQEGRDKIPLLPDDIEWHMIGRLQSNKAKYLPGLFKWVHSMDSAKLADALQKAYEKADAQVRVLIQVNVAGEDQKGGVEPQDALGLLREVAAMPNLSVEGLMTMAPFFDDSSEARPVFRRLKELAESLREETGLALTHLSMGMTNDFEVAIEEGATMVRIGTALYEGF